MKFVERTSFEIINNHKYGYSPDLHEYIFEEASNIKWVVSFVATVPYEWGKEIVYGDLFSCGINEINEDSIPVSIGSDRERVIIAKLDAWIFEAYSFEEVEYKKHAKYAHMTQEMVWEKDILWFTTALKNRRNQFSNL